MILKFITSNKDKVREVQSILTEHTVEQLDVEIPEVQSMNPQEIIQQKLEYGSGHFSGDFIVEDVSLSFPALNGLPGPLVKWFEKTLGLDGIYNLLYKYEDQSAEHKIVYGLSLQNKPIQFFEGVTDGKIVKPVGEGDFGWGPMFKPQGSEQTYGQLGYEEKLKFSPRTKALDKLKKHLIN